MGTAQILRRGDFQNLSPTMKHAQSTHQGVKLLMCFLPQVIDLINA